MNAEKWQVFRYALIGFAVISLCVLFAEGALRSITPGGVGILLLSFAAVAYAIYRYLKHGPDDAR